MRNSTGARESQINSAAHHKWQQPQGLLLGPLHFAASGPRTGQLGWRRLPAFVLFLGTLPGDSHSQGKESLRPKLRRCPLPGRSSP